MLHLARTAHPIFVDPVPANGAYAGTSMPPTKKKVQFRNAAMRKRPLHWEQTLRSVHDMIDGSLVPDTFLCNSALGACAKSNRILAAVQLLTRAREEHVQTDASSYNTFISAYGKTSQWALGFDCFRGVPQSGIEVDVIACNSLISSCEQRHLWRRAMALSVGLQGKHVEANDITYGAAITVSWRSEQWAESLRLSQEAHDRQLNLDAPCYNAAASACCSGRKWICALQILLAMQSTGVQSDTTTKGAAISASEVSAQWRCAIDILDVQARCSLQLDMASVGAAISTCEKGKEWARAAQLLRTASEALLCLDLVAHNVALFALAACGRWAFALGGLEILSVQKLMPDRISCSALISACKEAQRWELAVQLLFNAESCRIKVSTINLNLAISACDEDERWSVAVGLLTSAVSMSLELSVPSYTATIHACENSLHWASCVHLVSKMLDEDAEPNAITRSTVISACEQRQQWQAGLQLLATASRDMSTAEMCMLLWAFPSLSFEDEQELRKVSGHVLSNLPEFSLADLNVFSWAFASLRVRDETLFNAIARQLSTALDSTVPHRLPHARLLDLSVHALGIIWALHFAECLGNGVLTSARSAFRRIGRHFDETAANVPARLRSLISTEEPADKPCVVRDSSGWLVVEKPSGWQVDSNEEDLSDEGDAASLATYLQGQEPCRPILRDAQHRCGFLHRLDVPGSGLILAAKTYDAYYDLRLQLCSGRLYREYFVLCHGWTPFREDREISARVYWNDKTSKGVPSMVSRQGKPSRTHVKAFCFISRRGQAFTCTLARIDTGRRHQIRTHLAHLGHPVVSDGKYAAHAEFQSDLAWCQHILCRYRLAFFDAAGVEQDVTSCLPAHHLDVIRKMSPKDACSAEVMSCLVSRSRFCSWAEYRCRRRAGAHVRSRT